MTESRSTAPPPEMTLILLAALAVSILALGLYLQTLHPGVGPSLDSMELQIAALTGGVIHPPGSPQYLLLGQAIMHLPIGGSPAYRLNLLSALFAAATVGITFLLTYRLTTDLVASSFAALTLALGPRIWYQASIAELYTLNGLYVALVIYLLVTWHQTGKTAAFWGATVAYILSFGNHLTMILLLPVYLYAVQTTDRSQLLRPRNLAIIGGLVLLGAAQYLYIPLRVAAQPAFCNYCPDLSGGLGADVRALLDYVTGGPFKNAMFSLPRRELLARLPDSIGLVARQVMPWGLALGIVGLWEMAQRRAMIFWVFALGLAAESIFVLAYNIPDWHDFLTPVYVIFAPLVGYGGLQIWRWQEPRSRELLIKGQPYAGHAYPAALIAAAGLSVGLMLYTYWPVVDQSEDTAYIVNSRALLAEATPGALILMPHPNSPSFYYSWAVTYTGLAQGLDVTTVSAPEIDPPPGSPPVYVRWADVAPQLTVTGLADSGQQVLALDWSDERLAGFGLAAICADNGQIAGYEVVSAVVGRQTARLVDEARWQQLAGHVVYDGQSAFTCP